MVIFFTDQGYQPCIHPQIWRNRSLYICPLPHDGIALLYPQAPCFLFFTFCDAQGYGGGLITHLHTDLPLAVNVSYGITFLALRKCATVLCFVKIVTVGSEDLMFSRR
jgi:hypothetical protein